MASSACEAYLHICHTIQVQIKVNNVCSKWGQVHELQENGLLKKRKPTCSVDLPGRRPDTTTRGLWGIKCKMTRKWNAVGDILLRHFMMTFYTLCKWWWQTLLPAAKALLIPAFPASVKRLNQTVHEPILTSGNGTIWHRTIWDRGQFGTVDNLAPWTIWHHGQFGTRQFGTRKIWHQDRAVKIHNCA